MYVYNRNLPSDQCCSLSHFWRTSKCFTYIPLFNGCKATVERIFYKLKKKQPYNGLLMLYRAYRCTDVSHSVLPSSLQPHRSHQASLSMGFSRQEYWVDCHALLQENLPDPGIEFRSPALQADSFPSEPPYLLTIWYVNIWEKAMAPHSSTFAWKIPWTKEPGKLQSMWSHRVGDDWTDLAAAY